MNFEEYLYSKKIDSSLFKSEEAALWESWQAEFDQVHPSSFTAQKLYLINPIRRKYPLKVEETKKPEQPTGQPATSTSQEAPTVLPNEEKAPPPKPAVARPVFRPKPKMS